MEQLLSNFPEMGEQLEPTVPVQKNVNISNALLTSNYKAKPVLQKNQPVELTSPSVPTAMDPDLVAEHEKLQRKVRRRLQ